MLRFFDRIRGWFVAVPQRFSDRQFAAAKDALRPLIAKAVDAEAERKRKETGEKSDSGVRFSRAAPSGPDRRWSISCTPGSGDNARYSITGHDIPKSVFVGNAAKAKAVSEQLATEPQRDARKTFAKALAEYVAIKCEGSAPVAYKRAGISRQVYSRIVSSPFANVDKLTAMRFCIGLQLTEKEASAFLKTAGYAFSDAMPVDVVFSYCIRNRIFNIFDVNRLLDEMGQKPFTIVF